MLGPKKYYWHGLVHLQGIEFPVMEFHLLKSELNYLSSLKSELNILGSLKSEDNFESISEFIPSHWNVIGSPYSQNDTYALERLACWLHAEAVLFLFLMWLDIA